jgi:hypothetical protein
MTIEESIHSFTSFFENQERLVSSILGGPGVVGASSDPEIRVVIHKKILYCTILDSLAGIRYQGQNLSNRERFIAFVRDHGGWPEGDMISAPILAERLPNTGPPSPLQQHLKTKLSAHDPNAGNTLPSSCFDECRHVLDELAMDSAERNAVAKSQHYELFYKYRNFLVHEFREPGYGAEVLAPEACEPRYHVHLGDPKWRLLYPQGFLCRMIRSALASIRSYFNSAGIDPYTRIKDSSAWYE